jgi:hypothetical protein
MILANWLLSCSSNASNFSACPGYIKHTSLFVLTRLLRVFLCPHHLSCIEKSTNGKLSPKEAICMKRFLLGLLVGILLSTTITAFAAPQTIRLIVNGKEIPSDPPPQFIGDRVFVPVRFVAEALGAKVEWDDANRAVVVTSKDVQSVSVPGIMDASKPAGGSAVTDYYNALPGDPDRLDPQSIWKKFNLTAVGAVRQVSKDDQTYLRFENNDHWVELPLFGGPDVSAQSDLNVTVHGTLSNGRLFVSVSDLQAAKILPAP